MASDRSSVLENVLPRAVTPFLRDSVGRLEARHWEATRLELVREISSLPRSDLRDFLFHLALQVHGAALQIGRACCLLTGEVFSRDEPAGISMIVRVADFGIVLASSQRLQPRSIDAIDDIINLRLIQRHDPTPPVSRSAADFLVAMERHGHAHGVTVYLTFDGNRDVEADLIRMLSLPRSPYMRSKIEGRGVVELLS